MPFVECKVGIERKRFRLIEPGLGILERKQLSPTAPLRMERTHQVRLGTLTCI